MERFIPMPFSNPEDNEFIRMAGRENNSQNNGDKALSSGSNTYKPTYAKTLETGFMAQEVEQAAKELGYEFNGVDAPKNDKDFYLISHEVRWHMQCIAQLATNVI